MWTGTLDQIKSNFGSLRFGSYQVLSSGDDYVVVKNEASASEPVEVLSPDEFFELIQGL